MLVLNGLEGRGYIQSIGVVTWFHDALNQNQNRFHTLSSRAEALSLLLSAEAPEQREAALVLSLLCHLFLPISACFCVFLTVSACFCVFPPVTAFF